MSTEVPSSAATGDTAATASTGGTVLAVLLALAAAIGFVLGSRTRGRRSRVQKAAHRGHGKATHVTGKGSAGARNVAAAVEHRASTASGGVAAASVDALKKARRKAKKITKRLT